MRKLFFVSIIALCTSCNNNNETDKEIEKINNETKKRVEAIVDKSEEIKQQKQELEIEQRKMIIANIDRYVPVKIQHRVGLLGGIKNGQVYIENKTGFVLTKINLLLDVYTNGGELYQTIKLEFNNLSIGDSQSKPIDDTDGGVSIKVRYEGLSGPEISYGEELKLIK